MRFATSSSRDTAAGAVAALCAVAGLVLEGADAFGFEEPGVDLLGVLLMVVTGGAAIARRQHPLAAVTASAGALTLASALDYPTFLASLVSACVVGASAMHSSRRALPMLAAVATGCAVVLLVVQERRYGIAASDAVSGLAFALAPVIVGDAFRAHAALAREAVQRTRRIEQLRALEQERAVAGERLRIARDVHDVVGHHLSAIAIQAGAGDQRLAAGDVAAAHAALQAIRTSSSTALSETRRSLGLVRSGAVNGGPPLSGLGQLEELVDGARGSGLDIVVTRSGSERPLDPVTDNSAYRIVQESLTNIVRHASARQAHVGVHYGDRRLELRIDDDGVGGDVEQEGHGLMGMRERAEVAGGTCVAGPAAGGGWRVVAELPLERSQR